MGDKDVCVVFRLVVLISKLFVSILLINVMVSCFDILIYMLLYIELYFRQTQLYTNEPSFIQRA
jgi:hypothetical protein